MFLRELMHAVCHSQIAGVELCVGEEEDEPLPMTLRRSNCSIVSDSCRAGLKSILRWNAPEPAVAVYHWSDACCACGSREEGARDGHGGAWGMYNAGEHESSQTYGKWREPRTETAG